MQNLLGCVYLMVQYYQLIFSASVRSRPPEPILVPGVEEEVNIYCHSQTLYTVQNIMDDKRKFQKDDEFLLILIAVAAPTQAYIVGRTKPPCIFLRHYQTKIMNSSLSYMAGLYLTMPVKV